MVAENPEVLLDVRGDVHHAGPHRRLHLPVQARGVGEGQRQVSFTLSDNTQG